MTNADLRRPTRLVKYLFCLQIKIDFDDVISMILIIFYFYTVFCNMPTTNSGNVVSDTYTTLQWTVMQGDVQWLQQAVNQSTGTGAVILIVGICLFVIISSIIETGTFFGILLPSDLILSASVITFVGMKRWWMVVLVTILSIGFTILWDYLWYTTGKKLGSWLYDRKDTWYFKKKYFLEAQTALTKQGEKMLYIGRYLSIWWFLPMIYGVMNRDRSQFLKVSILSAMMWKLSLVIPITVLMLIFPWLQYRVGILLVLCFTLPEIVGWIMLLRPQAKEYMQRLVDAKEQIAILRQDFSSIKGHMTDLLDKVKAPDEQQAWAVQQAVPVEEVVSQQQITEQISQNTITHQQEIETPPQQSSSHDPLPSQYSNSNTPS